MYLIDVTLFNYITTPVEKTLLHPRTRGWKKNANTARHHWYVFPSVFEGLTTRVNVIAYVLEIEVAR